SLKWDLPEHEGVIPLWVADMDFRAAPCVIDALESRVAHGVFGYELVPDEWYAAVVSWLGSREGLKARREWLIPVPGAVPALSAALKAMTLPGDQVVTITPAYNCFFSSIRNTGCELSASPLKLCGGKWTADFDDLKSRVQNPRARVMLICNPHNPSGRLWTRDELRMMGELALEHGLFVISDEIHCDIRPEGARFTPFASLGADFASISVTLNAPSKAFNLAGCQNAYMMVPDPTLRERCDRAVNINEVCDVNPFGVAAAIAAYTHGAPWLDALNAYLRENIEQAAAFMGRELPKARFAIPDAGYLMWLDLREYCQSSSRLDEAMQERGVMLSRGTEYGRECEGFMRLNTACPRKLLMEGLQRMARGVEDAAGS
ncbi:MAG: MalY/PatB family protein, partial [Succinivibrio sp.]